MNDQQGGDSNWEKVRQEVTCAICLELLDDPKSMPCLHTYCKKCLMEALTKRPHDPDLPQDRPAINCPLCRAEVALSDQGIEALPTNFSATRLVETVQLQDKLGQNRAPKCDGCKANIAIASCCECGGVFLCSICYRAHQNLPITKTHHYVLLNEFTQSMNPVTVNNKSPLCQKHPQELLKLYCQDCEVLVCRDCVLVIHRTHNYNFVDDIAEKEKKYLKDVTLSEVEHILTSTSQAIGEVQQMQKKVQLKNDERIARLDQTFEEIAAIMQSRKKVLLQKIQRVKEEDLTSLKGQEEELMTLKKKLECCRDFTQDTLQNGTNSEVMSARKQMLARTKQLQKVHKSLPLSPVRKPTTVEYYQLDKIKEGINSVGVIVDCQLSSVQSVKEEGKGNVATVVVKDISGQLLSDAADFISAQAVPEDSIKATVDSIGGGSYMVSLHSKQSGDHTVTISVAGQNISFSPFNCQFTQENIDQEKIIKGDTFSQIPTGDHFDLFDDNHSANTASDHDGQLLPTVDHESVDSEQHNHSGTSLFVKEEDDTDDDELYYRYLSQRQHVGRDYYVQRNKKHLKTKKKKK